MKPDRCPTCHRRHKRSNEANRRYWLLLHEIADKVHPKGEDGKPESFSAESWHKYFKQRFVGCDEVKLPNRKTIIVLRSSADLDTAEFNDYMTQVEAWASEHNVYLADLPA